MKCVCGFKQKPDNVIVLKRHIEDCMLTGPLKDVYPDPAVVWRNHEFTVTTQVEEDEAIMDIGFVRPEVSRVNIENNIAVQETIVQNAVQTLDTPEEIIEAIQDVVLQGETAEVVEEKPAPKKRAPSKKKTSGA
jgi:hypothetical protein